MLKGFPNRVLVYPDRGGLQNVDDKHEQVMPVLVNVSECKGEVWCWEYEREGSMGKCCKIQNFS